MRLGEIKKTISKSLDDNNQIIINYEGIYDNKAYTVKNYRELIEIFNIIWDLPRNNVNNEWICSVIDKYWENYESITISVTEFNQLNNYFSQVNQKLPFYYSILETMVEEQNEQIINVKIPQNNIASLDKLNEFNTNLDKLFKKFNIDWEYEFKWLDKWTSWYEILIVWHYTYLAFLSCLDIAKAFFETRKAYFESKKAELDYKASLEKHEKVDSKKLKQYKEKRMNLEIEEQVEESLEKLWVKDWVNGKTAAELQNQLVMATKELVKELWQWTEFHLSLNPPKYAEENWYSLQIDYKQIATLIEEENKPKWLEEKTKKEKDSEDKAEETIE